MILNITTKQTVTYQQQQGRIFLFFIFLFFVFCIYMGSVF